MKKKEELRTTVTILAWVPMQMVVAFAEIKIERKEEKVLGERKCTELSFRHMLFNGVTSYPGTDSSRWLALCVLDMVCLSDCLICSHFNYSSHTNIAQPLGHYVCSCLRAIGLLVSCKRPCVADSSLHPSFHSKGSQSNFP